MFSSGVCVCERKRETGSMAAEGSELETKKMLLQIAFLGRSGEQRAQKIVTVGGAETSSVC